ncbi:MAG: rRNA processing protein [Cirrosporium novae-zelandiae]|nr:MAG: rRNA processing protein [Cirrosporium novae-zelandiae]
MGSSARKKKEKKKDFQKSKLKVGKTRPKADNFTDTSFRSKAIVVNAQSLNITAPSASTQFQHHLSLLTHRSDTQRRDSLAYLTTTITTLPPLTPLPQPLTVLLPKLAPLTIDGSASVRNQLLKLLRALPPSELTDDTTSTTTEKLLPYIRIGLTHLAPEIRFSTIDYLSWLLAAAGQDLVACKGGWAKTLKSFLALLGWLPQDPTSKWTTPRGAFGRTNAEGKALVRYLQVLSELLEVGLCDPHPSPNPSTKTTTPFPFPLYQTSHHILPTRKNAYAHLNLFGPPLDWENRMYGDVEDRRKVFRERYLGDVRRGVGAARREGGEVGRVAGLVERVLGEGGCACG